MLNQDFKTEQVNYHAKGQLIEESNINAAKKKDQKKAKREKTNYSLTCKASTKSGTLVFSFFFFFCVILFSFSFFLEEVLLTFSESNFISEHLHKHPSNLRVNQDKPPIGSPQKCCRWCQTEGICLQSCTWKFFYHLATPWVCIKSRLTSTFSNYKVPAKTLPQDI